MLAQSWMMPGVAGRDCEAAGRGQPVEEKEPSCQAEMLGGKVKWFFPGLVINKRVVRMERPNVDSRCFPGWWEQEGMGFSFWGAREVGKHLLHIPAHPWTQQHSGCWVSVIQPLLSYPDWGHKAGHPTSTSSPWLFELKIQPCSRLEVR